MSSPDRSAAFRQERAELLAFCANLGPDDWHADSAAPGWRIQDVVAHMGSACHAIFSPSEQKLLQGNNIERSNDLLVDARREWTADRAVREYRRYSRLVGAVLGAVAHSPLASRPRPLAELVQFPMRLFLSAMVFDYHTHLRHDMAPALGLPAPATDANRMAVALEWMMAVLSNQLRAASQPWLNRPIAILLAGPGGGRWVFGSAGALAPDVKAAVEISGLTTEFPAWGTRRMRWRAADVAVAGDEEYGAAFLDQLNVV